jgi:hypothetical protein
MIRKKIRKTIHLQLGGGAAAVGHGGRGPVCFQKFVNGGKLYMQIVAFDEIYNFVVQSCSIWSHHHSQIIDIIQISVFISRSQFSVYVKKIVTFLHELRWR